MGGLLLYMMYRQGGIPAGVINYLTGPGSIFEDEITKNQDIAGIAFTGSREVGMRLYRKFTSSSPYPKPIILETGSKNPVIVTKHADLDKAVEGIVRAAFGYSNQKCSAASRVYVQNEIKDVFLQKLIERTKKIVVGEQLIKNMEKRGIIVRSVSYSGVAEEFGGAYKSIDEVVDAVARAELSKKVVRLVPIGNIKG